MLKIRYDKLKNSIREQLKDYGKRNPDFYEPWAKANEGFSVTAQSKFVSNFIKKNAIAKLAGAGGTGLALKVFGISSGLPATAGVAATGYGALKSGELMYRISKSPALREHYNNVLKYALEKSVSGMNQSLKKLDDGLKTLDID
jgi:hypothetical protein